MRPLVLAIAAAAACSLPFTAAASTISNVTITGAPANPTISVSGTGFGTVPPVTYLGYVGYTGYDYGKSLYITDLSPAHGFDAGGDAGINARDLIGLVVLSYSDTQVVFQLGSDYSLYYYPSSIFSLSPGDPFNVVVNGASFRGNVGIAATPEPSSLVSLLTGMGASGLLVSRRRKAIRS